MKTSVALVIGLLLILMTACMVEIPEKLVTALVEKISEMKSDGVSKPAPTLLPKKESRTQVVVSDTFLHVGSGGHKAFRFTVTGDMEDARLVGSFSASGDSRYNVVVCLMDATAYENWVKDREVSTYYNSGQVDTDSFDLGCLRPGIYCLVYSNRFTEPSAKRVATRADLKFMR